MIKSIELKFTSGNDVLVERAVITRDEYIQIKQQAETIELLKHGMKGDYDLDQWLDWAISKKHMMETIERLSEEIKELKEKIYYYELPGKLIEQQQAD